MGQAFRPTPQEKFLYCGMASRPSEKMVQNLDLTIFNFELLRLSYQAHQHSAYHQSFHLLQSPFQFFLKIQPL